MPSSSVSSVSSGLRDRSAQRVRARGGRGGGLRRFSAYLQKSLAGIVKRLGGERYQRLAAILVQALEEQGRDGSVDTHRGWIEGLLKEYYDPMYAFQRQSGREDRVEFRGNQAEVIGHLRQRQALRPS